MIDPSAISSEIALLIREGGPFFVALLVLAAGIAYALLVLWRGIRLSDAPILAPQEWRSLLARGGASADIADRLRQEVGKANDPALRLQEVRKSLFAKPTRRFPFAFILIGAAPLVGLLGTVSGMFKTFRGMASTAAIDPIDAISAGISEALITTQTGLVIGVPTFIVCALMKSRFDALVLRFQKLETSLHQHAR